MEDSDHDSGFASSTSTRGLRLELRSLLLVYAALTVLPLLTGFACQG